MVVEGGGIRAVVKDEVTLIGLEVELELVDALYWSDSRDGAFLTLGSGKLFSESLGAFFRCSEKATAVSTASFNSSSSSRRLFA
ncbi:MAG: hypothetical protein OK457_06530 [Thaumarchaeota archaeon]|nr:hypothetical protein [Nitrososphaerota archaeon]